MRRAAREYVIGGAVLLGALLLFGPVTYLSVLRALEILLGVVGLSATGPAWAAAAVAAAVVALRVVTLVTRAQLHGLEDLDRGPARRRLGRYLTLLAPVVAVVVVAVDFVAAVTRWALANGDPVSLAVTGLVALALAAGIGRSVAAFGRGLARAR